MERPLDDTFNFQRPGRSLFHGLISWKKFYFLSQEVFGCDLTIAQHILSQFLRTFDIFFFGDKYDWQL